MGFVFGGSGFTPPVIGGVRWVLMLLLKAPASSGPEGVSGFMPSNDLEHVCTG